MTLNYNRVKLGEKEVLKCSKLGYNSTIPISTTSITCCVQMLIHSFI